MNSDDQNHPVPDKTRHNLPGTTEILKVDYNLASLFCYAPLPPLNIVLAIIFLITEPKENKFVRFHAIQSLILFAGMFVMEFAIGLIGSLLGWIPVLGGIVKMLLGFAGGVLGLAILIACVYMMKQAHDREMYHLPLIGDIAESNA